MTSHLVRIVAITVFLVLGILHPYMPGNYDKLSVALSLMIQAFGAVGLLVVPVGLVWLRHELKKRTRKTRDVPFADKGYWFAIASLVAGAPVAIVVVLDGFFSAGFSVGVFTSLFWVFFVSRLLGGLKRLKTQVSNDFNPVPIYLVSIPVLVFASQLLLAAPATEFSRHRAIAASAQLIGEIEGYHDRHGRYPASLAAVHQDYHTTVVGIEKFLYAPNGKAYDLFFEQPRFAFDNMGTREFVVFNKLNEHLIPSHAAWILDWSPEQLAATQGWYAVHESSSANWKYFWFD